MHTTAAAAHDAIRAHYGRGSRADVEACRLLAYGRFADVRAMADRIPRALQIVA